MSNAIHSPFIYVLCQAGAEPVLKKELGRKHHELRFAFSRPGFVTFKHAEAKDFAPDFELDSVFARAYGLSFGKLSATEPAQVLDELKERARSLGASPASPMRLHVSERELHAPGEEPQGYEFGKQAHEVRETILSQADGLFHKDATAKPGELVLDVLWIDENEWWIGAHQSTRAHSPFAGGRPPIALPPEAPSRAYLKLEEAVLAFGVPLKEGDHAIEIGSAPGGASYALLKRGLKVTGIDPGKMDPIVARNPNYQHVSSSIFDLSRPELPDEAQWVLLDMNAEPRVSLQAVELLSHWYEDSLLGLVLTIKLNTWKFADHIHEYQAQIKKLGMSRVRAQHLPSNRREFSCFALTRKGLLRAKG